MKNESEREVEKQVVTDSALRAVAKSVKAQLNGKAFQSMPRRFFTDEIRKTTGFEATRLKAEMAKRLESQLLNNGLRCFPPLSCVDGDDFVRVFHTSTIVNGLLDVLLCPGPETDREMASMTSILKQAAAEKGGDR